MRVSVDVNEIFIVNGVIYDGSDFSVGVSDLAERVLPVVQCDIAVSREQAVIVFGRVDS